MYISPCLEQKFIIKLIALKKGPEDRPSASKAQKNEYREVMYVYTFCIEYSLIVFHAIVAPSRINSCSERPNMLSIPCKHGYAEFCVSFDIVSHTAAVLLTQKSRHSDTQQK